MNRHKLNQIRFVKWKVWSIKPKIAQNSLLRSIGRKSKIFSLAINQRCHLCHFITKFLAKCQSNLWPKRVNYGLIKRDLAQMKDRRSLICQVPNTWSLIVSTKCSMNKKSAIGFRPKISFNRDVFSPRLSKDKSSRCLREMGKHIHQEAVHMIKDSTKYN